jgi:hypothetical protein
MYYLSFSATAATKPIATFYKYYKTVLLPFSEVILFFLLVDVSRYCGMMTESQNCGGTRNIWY